MQIKNGEVRILQVMPEKSTKQRQKTYPGLYLSILKQF
jgi:hypothetical protein